MTKRIEDEFVYVACTLDEHVRLSAPGGLIHRFLRAQEANLDWDVEPGRAELAVPAHFIEPLAADQGELSSVERELVDVLKRP